MSRLDAEDEIAKLALNKARVIGYWISLEFQSKVLQWLNLQIDSCFKTIFENGLIMQRSYFDVSGRSVEIKVNKN